MLVGRGNAIGGLANDGGGRPALHGNLEKSRRIARNGVFGGLTVDRAGFEPDIPGERGTVFAVQVDAPETTLMAMTERVENDVIAADAECRDHFIAGNLSGARMVEIEGVNVLRLIAKNGIEEGPFAEPGEPGTAGANGGGAGSEPTDLGQVPVCAKRAGISGPQIDGQGAAHCGQNFGIGGKAEAVKSGTVPGDRTDAALRVAQCPDLHETPAARGPASDEKGASVAQPGDGLDGGPLVGS